MLAERLGENCAVTQAVLHGILAKQAAADICEQRAKEKVRNESPLEYLSQLSAGFFSVDAVFGPVFDAAKTPTAVSECGDFIPGFKRMWDFTTRCFIESEHRPDPRKRPASWRLSGMPEHLESGSEGKAMVAQMQSCLSTWRDHSEHHAATDSDPDGTDNTLDSQHLLPMCGADVEKAAEYLSQGRIFSMLGEHLRARELYRKSLEAAEDSGDIESVCLALGALGSACLLLKDFEAACNNQKLRIELAGEERLQHRFEALLCLASATEAAKHSTQALQHCSEALEMARAASSANPSFSGTFLFDALGKVGALHCRLGRFGQAVSLHAEQLQVAMHGRKRRQVAWALMGFGNVCFCLGEHEVALDMFRESLAQGSTDEAMVGMLRNNTGNVHFALGDFHEAATEFRDCKDRVRELDRSILTLMGAEHVPEDVCYFLSGYFGPEGRGCPANKFFLVELFGRAVREYNLMLLSAVQTRNLANEYGAYIMQGMSLSELGHFNRAMEAYQSALRVTDREWDDEPELESLFCEAPPKWNDKRAFHRCAALGCIGRTWLLKREWGKAVVALEECVELASTLAAAAPATGCDGAGALGLEEEGEEEDVYSSFFAAPANDAENQEERAAYRSLARACFEAGEHLRALGCHQRYVELAEKTGDVLPGTQQLDFGALLAGARGSVLEHQTALRACASKEGGGDGEEEGEDEEEKEGAGGGGSDRTKGREKEGEGEGEKRWTGRGRSDALLGLGDAYLRCGLPTWAGVLFRRAQLASSRAGDVAGVGRAYGRLVDVLRAAGDLEGGVEMGQRQLECARDGGDERGEYAAYKRLGELLTEQGKAEEGVGVLKEWRRVSEARGDVEQVRGAGAVLVAALSTLGRVDQVLIAQGRGEQHALASHVNSANPQPSAVTDDELLCGDQHFHLGEFGSAVEAYARQLRAAEQSRDVHMQMRAARRLGRAFVRMGYPVKAAELQAAALQIARRLDDKAAAGEVLNDMGDRCLAVAGSGFGHEHEMRDAAASRSRRFVRKGHRTWQLSGAQHNYELALKMMRGSGNLRGQLQAHAGLGRVQQKRQRWSESTAHFEAQLRLALQCGDAMAQGEALLGLAKTALWRRGEAREGAADAKVGEIRSMLWSSVERFRSMEVRMGSFDQQRISLLELQQEGLQLLQTALLEQGGEEECCCGMALAVAEHAKARALLNTIRPEAAEEGGSAEAGGEEEGARAALEMEWDDLRDHLLQKWEKVSGIGRSERPGVAMVEFSFLEPRKLAVWVLASDGHLRASQVLDCGVDEELLFGGLPGWAGPAQVEQEGGSLSSCRMPDSSGADSDSPSDGLAAQLAAYHRGDGVGLTEELGRALDKEAAAGCFSLGALIEMARAALGVAPRDLRGPGRHAQAAPQAEGAGRSETEEGQDDDERFDRLFRSWANFQEGQGLTALERLELTLGVLPASYSELDTAYANPKLLARLQQAWDERKLLSHTLEKLRTANSAHPGCSPEEADQASKFGEAVAKLSARVSSWRELKEIGCKASRIEQDCGVLHAPAAKRVARAVGSLMQPQHLLAALHRLLIVPIAAHLLDAHEILLVPHRDLFEIPWAALGPKDGPCLVQQFALRVSPSLFVAAELARTLHRQPPASESAAAAAASRTTSESREWRALVVGNPLPCRWQPLSHAEEEARDVARMLAGALRADEAQQLAGAEAWQKHTPASQMCVDMLVRQKASRRAVSSLLAGCSWAHLACHGDLDTDSLLLAPDTDSLLLQRVGSSGDLSMMDVHGGICLAKGSTVVLSACNSGRGRVRGEGVVGLSRGFLAAGAACAVVSLWHLPDDSTSQFMRHFYTGLQQGMSTPAACRSAMLSMAGLEAVPPSACGVEQAHKKRRKRGVVNGPDFSAPIFWAPFVVSGASTHLHTGVPLPSSS